MESASPQLEHGFTRIANELLEALAALRCPASVFRITLAVIRETYGYNRKTAPVSREHMSEVIGWGETRVKQAVAEAVAWGVLARQGRELGLQKDYSRWGKPEGRTAGFRKDALPALLEGRPTRNRKDALPVSELDSGKDALPEDGKDALPLKTKTKDNPPYTPPHGDGSERRAWTDGPGACSDGNENDEQPKHIRDLCVCLGVDNLPEGWDALCSGWVLDFGDQREGSQHLRGLVAEEASRIRAGGRRKGGPRLSQWLCRQMTRKIAEKKTYYV